ncbi:Serine/threonine protein kinase [Gracilaria domingensis]|nr:Serine/threonine protein kinase [Gracilaria domingensis]
MRTALLNLYDQAMNLIPRTSANRHSPIYLQIWLDFIALRAEIEEDHFVIRDLFKALKAQRIGINNSKFWNAWADHEEKHGAQEKAAKLREEARDHQNDSSSLSLPSKLPQSSTRSATRRALPPPRRVMPSFSNDASEAKPPPKPTSIPSIVSKSLPQYVASSSNKQPTKWTPSHPNPSPSLKYTPTSSPPQRESPHRSPELIRSDLKRAQHQQSPNIFSPPGSPPPKRIAGNEDGDQNREDRSVQSRLQQLNHQFSSTYQQKKERSLETMRRAQRRTDELGRTRSRERITEDAFRVEQEQRAFQREIERRQPWERDSPRNFSQSGQQQEQYREQVEYRDGVRESSRARLGNERELERQIAIQRERNMAMEAQSRRLEEDRQAIYAGNEYISDRYRSRRPIQEPNRPKTSFGVNDNRLQRRHRTERSLPEDFHRSNANIGNPMLRYSHNPGSTASPQRNWPSPHDPPSARENRFHSIFRMDAPHCTVNGSPYIVLDSLGKGGSSVVYKVMDQSLKMMALKRVKVEHSSSSRIMMESYVNEIALLRKLRGSPNIVQLYDSEVDYENGLIHLVMECGEMDLNESLSKFNMESKEIDFGFIREKWKQMLKAVQVIHEARIVHGDLKPANFILVNGTLKLIDFGIAKAIQTDDTTKIVRDVRIGTPNYMSPEAVMEDESLHSPRSHRQRFRVGRASDIWSLGCILYQMVYGRPPFAHIKKVSHKMQCIQDAEYKIAYQSIDDPFVIDVLQGCLEREPADRMSIPSLLEHEFVRQRNPNRFEFGVRGGRQKLVDLDSYEECINRVELHNGTMVPARPGNPVYEKLWSKFSIPYRSKQEEGLGGNYLPTNREWNPTESGVTSKTGTRTTNPNYTNTNSRF